MNQYNNFNSLPPLDQDQPSKGASWLRWLVVVLVVIILGGLVAVIQKQYFRKTAIDTEKPISTLNTSQNDSVDQNKEAVDIFSNKTNQAIIPEAQKIENNNQKVLSPEENLKSPSVTTAEPPVSNQVEVKTVFVWDSTKQIDWKTYLNEKYGFKIIASEGCKGYLVEEKSDDSFRFWLPTSDLVVGQGAKPGFYNTDIYSAKTVDACKKMVSEGEFYGEIPDCSKSTDKGYVISGLLTSDSPKDIEEKQCQFTLQKD